MHACSVCAGPLPGRVEGVEGAQVVQVLAHVAGADVPADLGLLLDLVTVG